MNPNYNEEMMSPAGWPLELTEEADHSTEANRYRNINSAIETVLNAIGEDDELCGLIGMLKSFQGRFSIKREWHLIQASTEGGLFGREI